MAKATPKRVNASVMKGLLPAMVVPQKTKREAADEAEQKHWNMAILDDN
jgi:hypothetical protein